VVLKNGEVVAMGDHKTLLAQGNEYTRLYERQLLTQELQIEAT